MRGARPFASAREIQQEVRDLVRESGGSVAGLPRHFAEALASSPGFTASAEVTHALASAHAHGTRSEPFSHHGEHPFDESGEVEHAHEDHAHHDEAHHGEDPSPEASDEGPFIA